MAISDDAPNDEIHIVQDGDSLSKLLLIANDGDEGRMMEVVRALEKLQSTEGGVDTLKGFGIRSGDIAVLYPGDEIKVGAIQQWFEGGDTHTPPDENNLSDDQGVPEDVPLDLVPVEPDIVFIETDEDEREGEPPVVDGGEEDSDTTLLPEEVHLEEPSEEDTPEDSTPKDDDGDLVQTITDIAEESRFEERGLGFNASCAVAYHSDGMDTMLLEHFFRGHTVSQDLSVSHYSGFRLALTNITSVEGGAFSDLGDRTNLSVGLHRSFGSFCGSLVHQWVHTNHLMEQNFFYADRHRTSLEIGFSQGVLRLNTFVLSDVPAYTPVDEMLLYGGGGASLLLPVNALRTDIEIGASVAGSLFWYHRSSRMLYRVYAGFTTRIGGITLHPEISHIADALTGEGMITSSFNITF